MFEQNPYLVIGIMCLALITFVWERWRYDIVALGTMFALVILGQIDPNQALSGFGHPAVMTVLFALIISTGLRNSGVVNILSQRLRPYMTTPSRHVMTLTAAVTFISAFINNVGAIAIMLPVALASARRLNRSPTILLMPMAFGSLVGGMMTIIGTPPNIIVAEYRRQEFAEPFSMFEFGLIGLPLSICAILMLSLVGWRMMPTKRRSSNNDAGAISDYIMEMRAIEGCKMIGSRLIDLSDKYQEEVSVVGLVRGKDKYIHPANWRKIGIGDLLIVKTDPTLIQTIATDQGFEIVSQKSNALKNIKLKDMRLVEAVITPSSSLIGRGYNYFKRRTNQLITLMAVSRESKDIRTRLREVEFHEGDVLLMQGEDSQLDDSISALGLLPLAERDIGIFQRQKALLSLAIFAAGLFANVVIGLPITFALLGIVLCFVYLELISSRDLYKDVDWSIIILLGSMFALGEAMGSSGASEIIANALLSITGNEQVIITLILLMTFTMLLTNIINNAATAMLMCPIALELSYRLNCSSDMMLMTVCIGASAAFMTPIGHQSSTLVMGAAGYKFNDFWRLGIIMQLLVMLVSIPLLLLIWQ